ncbi:MAG: hypothetical protein JWO80_1907, partial [Bryobacterales bacterium]|nr:hypothetical protein [Bryobacterales bacterium]
QSGRAARDIDFGIAVENWDQFAQLKKDLVATGDFESDRRMLQGLIYQDPAIDFSIWVHLIPFRRVAAGDSTITWPPSRALASSVSMQIDENLRTRVASAPGLTLLKLVAWSDRSRETNKDAADLYRLLTAYADAGNTDRLYDQDMELLEAVGFDMELAGAELLGRDVARVCSRPVLVQTRSLLESEPDIEHLVRQMVQSSTYAEAMPMVERMVNSFYRGLMKNT